MGGGNHRGEGTKGEVTMGKGEGTKGWRREGSRKPYLILSLVQGLDIEEMNR